jgi:hypothetical protein
VATLSGGGAVETGGCDVVVLRVLVAALPPGDLVRVATLRGPHASGLAQAGQAAQGRGMSWPPSSPDFSPLEHGGAKRKTSLRSAAARTRRSRAPALRTAVQTIQPEDSRGWFRQCGSLVSAK